MDAENRKNFILPLNSEAIIIWTMKKIIILIAVITLSFSASAREYSYEKDILYKGSPDAYTEKMCRIDVAYEKGGEYRHPME